LYSEFFRQQAPDFFKHSFYVRRKGVSVTLPALFI